MDAQVKGTKIAAADAEKAKALQAALAQIEKQFGKGTIMRLGEGETLVRGKCRPHLVSLQTKHPRKRIGDADVVVNDEHTRHSGSLIGRHAAHCGARGGRRQGKRRGRRP